MPPNVKNFQSIKLSYFDSSVLNFLQKFHEQSLLSNVNLKISRVYSEGSLQQTLAQILPLIDDPINSIRIDNINMLEHSHEMLTILMARTGILSIRVIDKMPMDLLCHWLYGPEKLRMLLVDTADWKTDFIARIRKDFAIAEYPAKFFIRLMPTFLCDWQGELENGKTNEKLVIKKTEWEILVFRYPKEANNKWTEAKKQEILEWKFDYDNHKGMELAVDLETTSAIADNMPTEKPTEKPCTSSQL